MAPISRYVRRQRQFFPRVGLVASTMSTVTLLSAVTSMSAWAPAASAKPRDSSASRACVTAYKSGLELQQAGRLLEAQTQMQSCARAACTSALRRACAFRSQELAADIPSVVPNATSSAGAPMLDVAVQMDGRPLASRIDGRALAIDPGPHEFSFATKDAVIATEKVVILQGQRNRPLAIALDPTRVAGTQAAAAPATDAPLLLNAPAPAPLPPKPRSSVAPYLLGLVGVAGVTGFALFTNWGRKNNQRLAQCAPNCLPTSVDQVRQQYTFANISLGVGIAAAAATALTLWF